MKIANHPNPREIYKSQLIKEGVIDEAFDESMKEELESKLDSKFETSKMKTR